MHQPVKTLVCLIVFALCGCSAATLQRAEPEQLKLLPPADGPADFLLKQKITMVSRGQNQQFIAVTRLQQDSLKLVALLPTGQQLFFLEYDGEQLIQKNFSSIEIPSEDILAIMQFVLWPSRSIKHHYATEDGWIVETSAEQRTLLSNSALLIKVSYQAEAVIIENYLHDYQLRVQPLENMNL